ncbi:PAS domain S-box protein [Pseudodesulfovibrio cashew]|uniref:histidine kinase n=1 Tax=Pseudodesulfovibrio cashew TaxID=2678688 RepID=A0A6I6JFM6_9BACT|nr:PAS domain S-box protein [Pseudodesulfovibrio cashew]QGY39222.1 PAS domain S-box protein [Pseudodesulfovibrio cashew]
MSRRITYLIPLIVGLALGAALFLEYSSEQERHSRGQRLEVFHKLSIFRAKLEDRLDARRRLGEAVRSLLVAAPRSGQADFEAFVSGLMERTPGVRSVVAARENSVTLVYPPESREKWSGRNLLTDVPVQVRELVLRAMAHRTSQMTLPAPDARGGETLVLAVPVYLQPPGGGSSRYWGVVMEEVDVEPLFRDSGADGDGLSLNVAVRSQDQGGRETVFRGRETVFDDLPVSVNVAVPEGHWQLGAVPEGGWTSTPNSGNILYGGGFLVLLATGLLLATVHFLLKGAKERERYRHLVQNAKSIILRIDTAGTITFCNEYAERFFGYGPGQLVGNPLVGTLIPKQSEEGKSLKRHIHRLLHDPSGNLFNEILNTRKNGEMVWVAWANEAVLDRDGCLSEILCVGTDVTDRRLMEEALKQSERQYRLLAENVTDIIMGLDAGRRFTYVSPSDETLRGFMRHDVLSRPITDFLAPQSARVFDEAMDRLVERMGGEGKPPSTIMDLEFQCADETTVWLETRFGLLLNEERELIGMQGVGRDISDRKRAEALREDVERMARHDLKTPLGAVVGLPQEVKDQGGLNPTQVVMLDTIQEAGDSMLQLINRSLELYKMESGSYKLRKDIVDVLRVVEFVKSELRNLIRDKGISVGIQVETELDEDGFMVLADEPLLKSMLSNLLLNAFQASPPGGSVSVVLCRNGAARISIRNSGEVPMAVRETFFDRYTTASNNGGTGIGTYSARLIARTHGGDIGLDTSVPGETTVTVTLPA